MNFRNVVTGIALAVVAGLLNTSCTQEFDPSYLEQQIKDLDNRLTQLETTVKGMNSQIADLQTIVRSLESNSHILSIDQKSDETVITFSNGKTVVIRTSAAPQAPVIGVKAVDGVYYWTLDGEFLLGSDGNKLPVSGKDGVNGTDGTNGTDGHTPVIGVKQSGDDLYWTVDGEFLLDSAGNKVIASYKNGGSAAGDSIFKSVKVENGVVTITLNDGNSFVIPMKAAASLRIEANKLHFSAGEAKEIHLDLTNIAGVTVTDRPDGWRTSISGNTLKVQAPTAETAEEEGFITLLATSGDQTFIGKVKVTMEAPLFTMQVNPDGTMVLTELDTDFNAPGFWAGFVKADEFDAAAIVAPAKDYSPSKEDFYTSWSSAVTGKKSFEVKISQSIPAPKAGERYAAYCFPGAYSKWIGVEPDPYDVEVVYFTYVDGSFSVSAVTCDKATIKVSMSGTAAFYGGIKRYFDESELAGLAQTFLDDAYAPLSGYGDGMLGVLMSSYNGPLNMFAALDDGDGGKNAKSIVPGGKYAIALIPKDDEKTYSEYSVSDVIIKTVELNEPQLSSAVLASGQAGESTTTSASVSFDVKSSVSKFYYKIVTKEELSASGLSEYDYATRYGICWDRAILKASGEIKGISDIHTGLKPGQECIGIGVAFTTAGAYNLIKVETAASQVLRSSGTLSLSGRTLTSINANSTKVSVAYNASSEIQKIRYVNVSSSAFASEYGSSTDAVYGVLTAGSRWDYDEINAGSELDFYLYPENVEYTVFAVGMDGDGKFTALTSLKYKPID